MKTFNLFSLVVMVITALATFNAVAGESNKIHILQNLDASSLNKVKAVLKARGYSVSNKPIFTESDSTLIFTRTDANEVDSASIQFEIVMKRDKALPRTVYVYKADSNRVEDLLGPLAALPNPNQLKEIQIGSR